MTDLQAYQELVDTKAAQDSPDILPNAGDAHAAIVMAKMFEKTNQTVNMILGSFDGNISDQQNYFSKLEDCINKNIQFKILFLEAPNENSKAYNLLRAKKAEGKSISFASATEDVKKRLSKQNGSIHFTVFDNDKYRFEKDTKKYLAWACFNDKKNVGALLEIFNELFDKSKLM